MTISNSYGHVTIVSTVVFRPQVCPLSPQPMNWTKIGGQSPPLCHFPTATITHGYQQLNKTQLAIVKGLSAMHKHTQGHSRNLGGSRYPSSLPIRKFTSRVKQIRLISGAYFVYSPCKPNFEAYECQDQHNEWKYVEKAWDNITILENHIPIVSRILYGHIPLHPLSFSLLYLVTL